MAEIGTAAAIAIAATVISAGVGTYAAVSSAQAQEEAGEFNADVARNAALAEQQKASFEAQQVKRRNLLRLGEQRALVAKSGVTIESADDLIYDTALQGELERLAVLYGGNTASTYYSSKARLSSLEGRNAANAGYFQAGGTLLSGAAKVSDYNYDQAKYRGLKIK